MTRRLAVFSTHPIPYFSPIYRHLALSPDLELKVFYFSDHSIRGGLDAGFGVEVSWDVPLLEGYESEFLSRGADLSLRDRVMVASPEKLLAAGRFDAVLIQGYIFAFQKQVIRAARKLGIRTILYADLTDEIPYEGRGFLKRIARDCYLRKFYRNVDAFCTVGSNARDHLRRRGIPADRLFTAPFSVDTDLFERQRAQFDRGAERARLRIEPHQYTLMFSGKLIPRKAPQLLIEAIRNSSERDRISLIMIGDGELREQVVHAATDLLGERFKFPGFVNQAELGRYYASADAFVLPSEFETWGLVVNEAMQFGLPVITSNRVGSHRDLVIDGKTGFVFPSGDSGALSRAIDALSEPSVRHEMGANARRHIQRNTPAIAAAGIAAAVRG